jgi:hypothetical protein
MHGILDRTRPGAPAAPGRLTAKSRQHEIINRFSILLVIAAGFSCSQKEQARRSLILTKAEYADRVKAMWLGQLIAVHMGWDFEHKPAAVKEVTGYSPRRLEDIRNNGGARVDDDWYYEMVALKGFEKYGPGMSVDELGRMWLDYNMGTWGSAFYTRKALLEGIPGSESGTPRHNRMWFTVGNQNRSDLYAMITPGMVVETARLSRRLGRVNSYAEGNDGGVLMGALQSIAFYEKDIRTVMKQAVQVLDPSSPHRQCFELIIAMGESGKTWEEAAGAIERKYGLEYPATNSAVWNAGFAGVAMWYGNGDFLKSVNIGFMASDYADADCAGANVATLLGAMYGTSVFPEELVAPLNNAIKGSTLGFMDLTEPVDENLDSLTARTLRAGLAMLASLGVDTGGDTLRIPVPADITALPPERFDPNDFTRWWNPEWKLERAGFGAPGGGVRGIRGGTFVDGDILATYPRDEVRGVKLYRRVQVTGRERLTFETAADPGRIFRLKVYIDNEKVHEQLVDGGEPLDWPDLAPGAYPQPCTNTSAARRCATGRPWLSIWRPMRAGKSSCASTRISWCETASRAMPTGEMR